MNEFRVERGSEKSPAGGGADQVSPSRPVNAWETESQIDAVEIAADANAAQGAGTGLASLSGLLRPTDAQAETATPLAGLSEPPLAAASLTRSPDTGAGLSEEDGSGRTDRLPDPASGPSAIRPAVDGRSAPVAGAGGPDGTGGAPATSILTGPADVGQSAPQPLQPAASSAGAPTAFQSVLSTGTDARADPVPTEDAAAPAPDPSEDADPSPQEGPGPGTVAPDPGLSTVTLAQAGPLPEDAPAGTVVATLELAGARDVLFEITDADGVAIDHPLFEIDGNRIVLRAGATPDFETDPQIQIFIRTTVDGVAYDPVVLTIDIADVAEVVTLEDGGATFTDAGVTEIELRGGAGSDTITGGQGDDRLSGAAGDDRLIGGAGQDTAVYTGNWSDYDIFREGSDLIVRDTRPGSPDGTDTLRGIEMLTFADRTLPIADVMNVAPALQVSGGKVTEGVAGQSVGRVTATDPNEGDRVTLTLDDPRFEIAGGTLRLRQEASLDFETDGAAVEVTVTATDLLGAQTRQVVRVDVQDTPEGIELGPGGRSFTDASVAEAQVRGGTGADTITGSAGDDLIDGDDGNDSLYGGAGDDDLTGGRGDDRIDGGGGTDTARWSGDVSTYSVALEEGTFTVTDLIGDTGSDRVAAVEVFVFGDRTLSLAEMRQEAARQSDTPPDAPYLVGDGSVAEDASGGSVVGLILGGDPDGNAVTYDLTDAKGAPLTDRRFEIVGNEIRVRDGAVFDYETAPVHRIFVTARTEYNASAPTELSLTVTDRAEGIDLGPDTVEFVDTGVAETFVRGGDGANRIVANEGGSDLFGGGGDDTLVGGTGDDRMDGGAGADLLWGGDWDDTLLGGDGDDRLHGGEGFNLIDGGAGQDTAVWDLDVSAFEISHDAATDRFTIVDPVGLAYSDEVVGVETFDFAGITYSAEEMRALALQQQADRSGPTPSSPSDEDPQEPAPPLPEDGIVGTSGDDTLTGGTGADRIFGGAGDDLLFGGQGDASDMLYGGTGFDELDGGGGSDTYVVEPGQDWTMISDGGLAWTDTILLEGVSGGAQVSGETITGTGWTMILDSGSSVTAQGDGMLDLSDDASGILTFDDGSTVDFIGIDRIAW